MGFCGVHRLHLKTRTVSATAFDIFTPCLVFTSLLHIQLDLNLIGHKYREVIVRDCDV